MGLYLLSCSARTVGISPSSYHVVAQAALPSWTLAVDLAVAIKCFGVATSYLIVIGNLMPDAMRGILPHDSNSVLLNRHFWITVASIAIAPLAAQRSFSSLKYTATLAIGFVSFLVTMVFAYAVVPELRTETCAGSGRSCDKRHDVRAFGSVSAVLRVLSIFVFAFTCHQNIFSVFNEIKAPTQQRVNTVILMAISTAVGVHLVLSWCAYSTFGSGVAANILENYPHGALLTCARVCVSLLVATGYPLQAHPSRRSLLTVVQTVRAHYRRRKREQNIYSALASHSTSVDINNGNHSNSLDVHSSSSSSLNGSYRNSSSKGNGNSNRVASSSVSPMRKPSNHQSALQHIPPLHTSSKQSTELPLYDATQQLAKRRRSQNSKIDDSSSGGGGGMNNSHHGRVVHSNSTHELQALMQGASSSACSSPVMRKSPRDSRHHFSTTASGGRSNDVSLRRNTSSGNNGKVVSKRGDSYFCDESGDGATAGNGNASHISSSSSTAAVSGSSATGYVHYDRDSSISQGNSSDDDMSPDSASQAMFTTITVAFVLSTYVIAMAVSDLGVVLEIVGATGSTIISYVLPGSTYLALHPMIKGKFQSMRLFASIQLVVGCIIMPVCLFFVIRGERSH
jgi:amino acid permease